MEKMVLQYGQDRNIKLETELWHTGEEVCQYLRDRRPLDILFLDIELLAMSGIQVGGFYPRPDGKPLDTDHLHIG